MSITCCDYIIASFRKCRYRKDCLSSVFSGSRLVYNKQMSEIYEINDIVTLKKAHPCGGRQWLVVRLGAEIGLECMTCKHRVLLSRRELRQRMKGSPEKGSSSQPDQSEK